jgi:hypothetical protein
MGFDVYNKQLTNLYTFLLAIPNICKYIGKLNNFFLGAPLPNQEGFCAASPLEQPFNKPSWFLGTSLQTKKVFVQPLLYSNLSINLLGFMGIIGLHD